MTDIRLKQKFSPLEVVTMDFLLLDSGLIDQSDELATLVRVALGTDALAAEGEVLPDPDSTDRRGWWGDWQAEEIWDGWPIGCKNWLLTRAKITQAPSIEGSTLLRAKDYTVIALVPLLEKRIATRIEVEAIRTAEQNIEVYAIIYRGPLPEIDLRYQPLWLEPDVIDEPPMYPVVRKVPAGNLTLSPKSPNRKETYIAPPSANLQLSVVAPVAQSGILSARRDLVLSPTAPTVRTQDHGMVVPQGNLVLTRTIPTRTP